MLPSTPLPMWRVAASPPMWRVVPAPTQASELAALRAENASLVASLASLHMRYADLQAENAHLKERAVVRSLCSKVVDLTKIIDEMHSRERKLMHRLEGVRAEDSEVPDLRERIFQLESGIEAVQEANHLKTLEINTLKKNVEKIKECFTCSISQDLMQEPRVLSTGHMYNQTHISEWLRRSASHKCPNTNGLVQWHDYPPVKCPALNEVAAILAQM